MVNKGRNLSNCILNYISEIYSLDIRVIGGPSSGSPSENDRNTELLYCGY